MDESPQRGARIAMGIAGFLVFVASAPCLLLFIRDGYVTGFDDLGGVLGIIAMALLGLFAGSLLLYKAIRQN